MLVEGRAWQESFALLLLPDFQVPSTPLIAPRPVWMRSVACGGAQSQLLIGYGTKIVHRRRMPESG